MRTENSEAVVRQWVEDVLNHGDLDAADRLLSQAVVFHHAGMPNPFRGVDAVKRGHEPLQHGFKPRDDVREPLEHASAAEIAGVVHHRLETEDALALRLRLQCRSLAACHQTS